MIPIFRGKKIDSDEWVNGYLTEDIVGDGTIVIQTLPLINIGHLNVFGFENIDSSILEISFDNGETFDTIEDVVEAVNIVKHQAEIWKEK